MDTAQVFEIVRLVLGGYGLQTAPEALVPVALPEASRAFLSKVGLPGAEVQPGLDFNLMDRLPTPDQVFAPDKFTFHETWRETRLTRERHGFCMYLDLVDGGTVWELDPRRPDDATFINSNVELLGLCLAIMNAPVPADGPPDPKDQLSALEDRLREADPAAFEDGNRFWPLVIEDQSYYT